jgi:hypothetical protein
VAVKNFTSEACSDFGESAQPVCPGLRQFLDLFFDASDHRSGDTLALAQIGVRADGRDIHHDGATAHSTRHDRT